MLTAAAPSPSTTPAASSSVPRLEVLRKASDGDESLRSAFFVHGAFHAAWFWEPWLETFAEHGRDSDAVSLRGHGASEGDFRSARIEDHLADLRRALATLSSAPVLVGHSFGAVMVQHLLAERTWPAAVLVASPPARFPLRFTLEALVRHPILSARSLRTGEVTIPIHSLEAIRASFFSQETPDDVLQGAAARITPEGALLFRQMSRVTAPLPKPGTPILVVAAEHDPNLTAAMQQRLADRLGAELLVAPRSGHNVPLDIGSREMAAAILAWLGSHP